MDGFCCDFDPPFGRAKNPLAPRDPASGPSGSGPAAVEIVAERLSRVPGDGTISWLDKGHVQQHKVMTPQFCLLIFCFEGLTPETK